MQHLSLHYDGVRVDRPRVAATHESVQAFCDAAAVHIAEQTGFAVDIIEKQHFYFLELLERAATGRKAFSNEGDSGALLDADGNCIPAGIHYLGASPVDILNALATPSSWNDTAQSNKARSYRECGNEYKVLMEPHFGFSPMTSGSYIIHSEPRGRPHGAACKYDAESKECVVFFQGHEMQLPLSAVACASAGALDKASIVTFQVGREGSPPPSVYQAQDCVGDLSELLDLQAGAGNAELELPEQPPGDFSDEARVDVSSVLSGMLRDEKDAYIQTMENSRGSVACACTLCPFRKFTTSRLLMAHVKKHHVKSNNYVASGKKQSNVISALFDSDKLRRADGGSYLARSAALMRSSITPPLRCDPTCIDREIVLVLSAEGPRYENKSSVVQTCICRRAGYTYYTRGFANLLVQASLLHHARVRSMVPNLSQIFLRQGSELVSLLPTNVVHWLKLLEDTFACPFVVGREQLMIRECADREEFEHISMDATFRARDSLKKGRGFSSSPSSYFYMHGLFQQKMMGEVAAGGGHGDGGVSFSQREWSRWRCECFPAGEG